MLSMYAKDRELLRSLASHTGCSYSETVRVALQMWAVQLGLDPDAQGRDDAA